MTTDDYDFSGLTTAQQWLLTVQGWAIGSAYGQPSKKTVAKLLDRGLLVSREVKQVVGGGFRLSVTEYVVPIPVHVAWCEHCGKIEDRKRRRSK